MKITKTTHLLILTLALAIITLAHTACVGDRLYEGFRDPPPQAKPFVRWWWNGDCVTEKEILRQLDLLEEAGVGGVEINPIAMPPGSAETGTKALAWLSPEWNRMLKTAVEGARDRGMIPDLIVGSGWPFGGRFLPSGQTIQGVSVHKKELDGPSIFETRAQDLMKLGKGGYEPEDAAKPRLFFLRLAPQAPEDVSQCIDLMDSVAPDGTIRVEIPEGKHILYAGTWQEGSRAVTHGAPGADGQVLDHFNKSAVETYLDRMSDSLTPYLGGRLGSQLGNQLDSQVDSQPSNEPGGKPASGQLGNQPGHKPGGRPTRQPANGLRAMFCDSIELSGSNWTSDLPQEFQKRRGYPLDPYLPFVLDRDDPQDQGEFQSRVRRARYDFSKTLVELFHERFINTFHAWCRRNGVQSRYQAYGSPWLMGMLDGYMACDIPEGDTWLFNTWTDLDEIRYAVWNKYASSGAHLAGRPLVGCEAMTNTRGVFAATLEYIKQGGDLTFITGVNHFVLHGFNYSPPEAGFPGWVRYGTYFNEQNPWWPYFRRWAEYNARLSWVFQETRPEAQVAILGPTEDVWSRHGLDRRPFVDTPPYLHFLWQALHQNGYCADYVNGTVLRGATSEGGKLRYGPMAYEVLLVAGAHSVEPETARAMERFAAAGGRIVFIGTAPVRSPGLEDAAKKDVIVREAIEAAMKAGGERVAVVEAPGEERGEQVADVEAPGAESLLDWAGATLEKIGVEPAVKITPPDARLFQIHHSSAGREIFFFSNLHREQSLHFEAVFATGERIPWRWDPETGDRAVYPHGAGRNELDILLKPLESLLLVFEPGMNGDLVRTSDPVGQAAVEQVALEQVAVEQVAMEQVAVEQVAAEPSAVDPEGAEPSAMDPAAMAIDPVDHLEIKGPWKLTLNPVEGELFTLELDALTDFIDDERLASFGGTVLYETAFDAPDPIMTLLNLGRVHGTSEVWLNGKLLGVKWWGERLYNAGDALQPGRNTLKVKVAIVLSNYCRTLEDNPTAKRWTRGRKPVSAGMVGPVRLFGKE